MCLPVAVGYWWWVRLVGPLMGVSGWEVSESDSELSD